MSSAPLPLFRRSIPLCLSDSYKRSFKQYIILFGGFQDTANQTRYLADLWLYDTQNFVWHSPALPPAQLKPDARSSFTFLPHEQGAVLYGGYSRVKPVTASATGKQANKSAAAAAASQRNALKPMVHQDCFFLRVTAPPAADAAAPGAPPTVRWERRKRPANAPAPSRAGATMTFHRGRGVLFGGVHDVEQGEEGMDSEFFNGLFAWNVERNRFFPLALRKPRAQKKAGEGGGRGGGGGRRGRAAANEEELLRGLAALRAGAEDPDDAEEDDVGGGKEGGVPGGGEDEKPVREMPVSMELPHPRFNAQLAVQDDVLYIYGGTFEKGDREFTFDDLYAVDLGKLDGCKEIFSRPVEDWIVSHNPRPQMMPSRRVIARGGELFFANLMQQASEDEDEDDEDDEDEEDEDEEEEDEDGDVQMADEEVRQLMSPSKRNKKRADEVSTADSSEPTTPSVAGSEEEWEADTTATTVDDGLPHPRVCPLFRSFCLFRLPPSFLSRPSFPPLLPSADLTPIDGGIELPSADGHENPQPFESRREFFQRTTNEWQEVLITSLRWKGIQPESLTVKEIKSKAFELSEEKWWDCREEITALEDEQEAAGIGEVVSLADRGGTGAAGGGAMRRR